MISVESIHFQYPNGQILFEDFTWNIERGEAWSILGPSGCGKSTLLYILAGLLYPNQGQVLIDGLKLTRPRPKSGLILQDYGLLPWATVRQNAQLGLQIRGFYGPDGTHSPREMLPHPDVTIWLERLGLTDIADSYPAHISGGQRQRTAIARTLVLNPDLLLMDEPFSSLDAPTRESLQNLTLELQEEQKLTLIMVTHSIEEAAILGNKILLLGRPPHRNATIIQNPHQSAEEYRKSQNYHAVCDDLRSRLEKVSLE
ncbi:MAG: ABC transporter ATP-binding protein [Anaerolineales bacterium]